MFLCLFLFPFLFLLLVSRWKWSKFWYFEFFLLLENLFCRDRGFSPEPRSPTWPGHIVKLSRSCQGMFFGAIFCCCCLWCHSPVFVRKVSNAMTAIKIWVTCDRQSGDLWQTVWGLAPAPCSFILAPGIFLFRHNYAKYIKPRRYLLNRVNDYNINIRYYRKFSTTIFYIFDYKNYM